MESRMCPQYDSKNNSQCSLVLELDFEGNGGAGVLMIEDIQLPNTLMIITRFGLQNNVTKTVLIYKCTTSDNCAFEFLKEFFNGKLYDFNANAVRNEITRLLYSDHQSISTVDCHTNVCENYELCQGNMLKTISNRESSTSIRDQLPCLRPSASSDLFYIEQMISFPNKTVTNLTIACNLPNCNNDNTITNVFSIYDTQFRLPINYSAFDQDPSSSGFQNPFFLNLSIYYFFVCVMFYL